MADKKVVGIAENLIRFKTDRESMNRALRDIKKVKEELKSVQGSTQKVKQQTQSATRSAKQRTDQDKDWLTVQRAINKNNKQKIKDEAQLLKHQERKLKLEREHAKVLRQKHIEARKAATAGLTAGAGTSARGTLFADMLRAEDAYNKRRDNILSRRDAQRLDRRIRRQASIDKLHGQALAEDARRTNRSNILSRNSASRRMDMTNADMFNLSSRFGSSGNARFAGIAAAFQNGDISARMYRQQVSALRRDLSSAASAQRGFNGTLRDMRSAIIQATASYTAFAAIQGIADVGKNYESRNAGMLVATGSKEKAAQNSQYLDYQIRRLGLDYNVASKGYVQLGVAGAGVLNQDQVNSVFKGLSELGTAVQLDPMRYEKAILAISQMMGKRQIMA